MKSILSGLFFFRFSFVLIITLIFNTAYSQEDVIYKFEEGLVIQPGIIYGRTAFQKDTIAQQILNGKFKRPVANEIYGKGFRGKDAKWEVLTLGDKGYFHSMKFRGGGFYLEYESEKSEVALLKATGHTMAFINGIPREGDHYDFKFTVTPVKLKKGINQFYFTGGRFPRMKAELVRPTTPQQILDVDLTLPDLIIEDDGFKWGQAIVVNSAEKATKGLTFKCLVNGSEIETAIPVIQKLTTRRVGFKIPELTGMLEEKIEVELKLLTAKGKELSNINFSIKNKTFDKHHDRTFISEIDGSVQYYSVQPGKINSGNKPALFLSVHGAGVQARGQAGSYKPKDWGHVIAPTNRRPYGFAWEDWGRIDALEVLELGRELFNPDPSKIYLTGHSMGGHGTWYLGATYPDKFAAIAPCAGYPDLMGYARRFGKEHDSPVTKMFDQAGKPVRTKKLARNYLQQGVYVHHGQIDQTVPIEQAREMRKLLATFHTDFAYYEYPQGKHWFGSESVDWLPIFDFFKTHQIPESKNVDKLEFYTANPGVSSKNHWIEIYQQKVPFDISSVKLELDKDSSKVSGAIANVSVLGVDNHILELNYPFSIILNKAEITINEADSNGMVWLKIENDKVTQIQKPSADEKGPLRNGNFKDAFRNNMVFVYGTNGNKEENKWMYYKARFDAETFGYRGNGTVEIISDKEFEATNYTNRNIIVFGNSETNTAWASLLADSPVQVKRGEVQIGEKTISGDDLAIYFVQARRDSDVASIGVIAGTGVDGFKAGYANQYFLSGSAFPDITVFRKSAITKGSEAVECLGFFGNDWSVKNGDFVWSE